MCEQCQQIDEKIRRARKLATGGFDSLTVERITQMIRDLERSKDAIHGRK
jgi:hypothetical protein